MHQHTANGATSLAWEGLMMSEEEEPEECPACDGMGELPGNPNTNQFPTCSVCNGTGIVLND